MADVTDATFGTDVIERSKEIPVVVDLWAEWCGPCKTLGPILEKVIAETGGRVELAKVDVDANPGTAQAFQVQGIPAVYAMKDGQPVDGFVGAQGEDAIREFVNKLLPSDDELETESLLAAGDEQSLLQVLSKQPDHPVAVVKLAELLVGRGETDLALELLQRVPETIETRRVAALARTGLGAEVADVADAAPGAAPTDDYDAQLTALLDKVKGDDDARQQFVDLLEVMGPEDPRVAGYRKQLSARLF